MAFGVYEYPHTELHDSELSEVLMLYHKLVNDYNEIVEKLRKAEADWQYSMDYVNKWNSKWAQDINELRQKFHETTEEIKAVQEELINRFEVERTAITHYMDDVLSQIKTDNWETKNYIDDEIDAAIDNINADLAEYNKKVHDMLEMFKSDFEGIVDNLNELIVNNMNDFKLYISTELGAIMSIINSYESNINSYHSITMEKFDNLLAEYRLMLENAKSEYQRELGNAVVRITREYSTADENILDIMREKIADLNSRIDEVEQMTVDIRADKVLVMSPVTHRVKRIQWTLDEMWTFYQVWALEMWEMQDLGLTVEQIRDWICDKGLLPNHVGVEMLDLVAMGKWIFLEKPDIIAQVKGDIEKITYEKLNENADRIEREITANTIANVTTYFSGIISTVTYIAGELQPMQGKIDENARVIENHENAINENRQLITGIQDTLDDAEFVLKQNGNIEIKKGE